MSRFSIAFLSLLACAAFAADSRPSKSDIKKASERGAALRQQTKLVPGVPQASAAMMKAGGVPCGYAGLSITDAKGEGGAVYKLTEQYKAGLSEEGQQALMTYRGTMLLAADLALISGRLEQTSELTDKTKGNHQIVSTTIMVEVKGDEISWHRRAQRKDEKDPFLTENKKLSLHGVKPIPKTALPGLAALHLAAQPGGWKPDPKDALCVPVLDANFDLDSLDILPAWIAFDVPTYMNPKETAAVMRVRELVGEVGDNGLDVEPPTPQVWQAHQDWALDAAAHVLAYPSPDDPRIKVERLEHAALETAPPLDLDKIAEALKAAAAKPAK
ncbi:MAG TPA: hypothetical protein VGP72_27925 [Planctomycetota bacterium]|jgi:hypothetical protein